MANAMLKAGAKVQVVTKVKRRQYTQENVDRALIAIRTEGYSLRGAAEAFGVPRSTLSDKFLGKTADKTIPGASTLLTPAEEKELYHYVKRMSEIGYGLIKEELLQSVKRILDADGRPNPCKDNKPGKQWYYGFLRSHPELSRRTPENLGRERAIVTPTSIEKWFKDCEEYFTTIVENGLEILHDPTRIFNCDESGFPLAAKSGKILAIRGTKNCYRVTNADKGQITVLCCFSPAGFYVKPMVVFPLQRVNASYLRGAEDFCIGRSDNGWMNSHVFYEWVANHFYPSLKENGVKFPVILFLDGHSSHINRETSKFCEKHEIHLYCLLPHASHIMQPCDISLYKSLKSNWSKAVQDFQKRNVGEFVTKREFSQVFKQAYDMTMETGAEKAASGFRSAGLYPWDMTAIDMTKTLPSETYVIVVEQDQPSPVPAQVPAAVGSPPTTSTPHFISEIQTPSSPFPADVPAVIPGSTISSTPDLRELPLISPLKALEQAQNLSETTIALYEKRYEEGYNLQTDIVYNIWRTLKSSEVTRAPAAAVMSTPSDPHPSTSSSTLENGATFFTPSRADSQSSTLAPTLDSTPKSSPLLKKSQTQIPTYVSPAFKEVLRYPNIERNVKKRKGEELPRAVSGKRYLQYLNEKAEEKAKIEKEKEERKKRREENKQKREKQNKKKKAALSKPDHENTDTSIDENICHVCNTDVFSNKLGCWIGCEICPRWFHKRCVGLGGKTQQEIEKMDWVCKYHK